MCAYLPAASSRSVANPALPPQKKKKKKKKGTLVSNNRVFGLIKLMVFI